MLTADDYGAIRRARRDGQSIRRIARELGLSRITVRKALKQPQPVAKIRDRPAPKLGPFQAAIEQILAEDELAPPKQRHTAATSTATPAGMPRSSATSGGTGY